MRELTAHFSWSLTPNAVLTGDLDESFDVFMGLTPQRVREEMALWFSAPSTGVPALLRHAIDGLDETASSTSRSVAAPGPPAVEPISSI